MATFAKTALSDLANKIVIDLAADTTAEVDVTGTTGSVYMIEIDATAGAATTAEPGCYLKLIDADSGVTGGGGSGSTPEMVLYAPIGKKTTYVISGGWAFGTGLSLWAVTTAPVAGNVSPTSDIKVTILTT